MSSESSITKDEPSPIEPPIVRSRFRYHVDTAQRKLTTRRGWLGDYDYAWLCLPTLPFSIGGKKPQQRKPPFYGPDDELPLLLAMASGLQQALSMVAGVITPPIIFARTLALGPETSAYLISASLIACGVLSLIQISRIQLWKGYYLGTGLLSIVGTGFAVVNVTNAIFSTMYANGMCPSVTHANGTVIREACPDAYGMILGTSMICSFLEIGLSFIPPRMLQRMFPPMVTGTVIVMIGASLIGSFGIANWGGGSNGCQLRPASGPLSLCPTTTSKHALPWGSPEFIGLGFLSFVSIIIAELFGSPFLKNTSIIVGLVVGCIVAGAAGYIDFNTIASSPAITFLWFKIGVYPPAILPMLAVYLTTTMEGIGDITGAAEVSHERVTGDVFDSRLQGGILSDGIGGFLSALFTMTPMTVLAQNNGVIALTRCASRAAGRWCCVFLILFGTLGKISGALLAIPNPILGGVSTFLFANVLISGLSILSYTNYTRRARFILAAAMSFGIGNILMPEVFTHLFDGVRHPNAGLQGLFDSITIVLSTPYLISGLVAVVLNVIVPREEEDGEDVMEVVEHVEALDRDQKV